MSLKTLKRRLKQLNLSRRASYTPMETVNSAIRTELNGSGQLLGYRAMWQTLQQTHSLTARRDHVMQALRFLNPERVSLRHRRRFFRRSYCAAGPNQVWHVDGYDKLKPFGIAISGCIDGYSRRLMWLSSGSTNNNPAVIARYYLQRANNQSLLLSGCVAEWGKRIRNVNGLVVSRGSSGSSGLVVSRGLQWVAATLPPDSHPLSVASRLLGVYRGTAN
ncbi:hypothetical protein N1851_030179 [Merluccius polli]|uniref:Integrase core domain-containing protein n=1 Tax=Merluccius polli TaxID=89951 RepID=A0AA47M680_MERPO|nr:hypothetical protein N1851_030179 [Merluccius polli]